MPHIRFPRVPFPLPLEDGNYKGRFGPNYQVLAFEPGYVSFSIPFPGRSTLSSDAKSWQSTDAGFVCGIPVRYDLSQDRAYQFELVAQTADGVIRCFKRGKSLSVLGVASYLPVSNGDHISIRAKIISGAFSWDISVNGAAWSAQSGFGITGDQYVEFHLENLNDSPDWDILTNPNDWQKELTAGYDQLSRPNPTANMLCVKTMTGTTAALGSSPISQTEATIHLAYYCDRLEANSTRRIVTFERTGNNSYIEIRTDGTSNNRYIRFYYERNGSRAVTSGTADNMENGALNTIDITYGTNDDVVLYVNGVEKGRNTGGNGNTWDMSDITRVRLGTYDGDGGCNGYIGDLAIWDDIRSSGEISDDRLLGAISASATGLAHLWRCREHESASTIEDQVGSADITTSPYGMEHVYFQPVTNA